jgi:hypothetical protein
VQLLEDLLVTLLVVSGSDITEHSPHYRPQLCQRLRRWYPAPSRPVCDGHRVDTEPLGYPRGPVAEAAQGLEKALCLDQALEASAVSGALSDVGLRGGRVPLPWAQAMAMSYSSFWRGATRRCERGVVPPRRYTDKPRLST